MFKKKLNTQLSSALETKGITEPTELQKLIIPKIKSGASCMCTGPHGSGKTTSIVIGVIQRLTTALNDVPRAIIVVEEKQQALDMKEQFNALVRQSELRVHCAVDGEKFLDQKDKIYAGSDVVIGTARRFNELYVNNGLNLNALQIFAIDNSDIVIKNEVHSKIERLAGGVGKVQWLIFGDHITEKTESFISKFLPDNYETVEVEDEHL